MGEISVKTGNNARNGGKNSLNRLIRCVCGKKIGPDPRNFNQRVSLGRNDLLIRTFLSENIASGHLVQVLPEYYQPANVWAVYVSRLATSAKVRITVEFLRQYFADHYPNFSLEHA
ncbi:hypothetical protein DP655_002641 [Escherichia coli]|nr:hypothetical protein [Escherichia coli]EEY6008714.1 hypothetical protein [Escherichia coli]